MKVNGYEIKPYANLAEADLRGADLTGANLYGANLYGANLRKAKVNWQSHTLLGELLYRAAGEDLRKNMIAGLVCKKTNWCWDRLVKELTPEDCSWCVSVLKPYIQEDDDLPEVFREALA